jgi:hypothetical protein
MWAKAGAQNWRRSGLNRRRDASFAASGQVIRNRLALPGPAEPSGHMMRGKLRSVSWVAPVPASGDAASGSVAATAGWARTQVASRVLVHDPEARRAFELDTLRPSCLWNSGEVLMIDNDIATLKHLAQGGMAKTALPLPASVGFGRNSFGTIS